MDDDAMNNESNRTGVSPSLEKEIADVMKQFKLKGQKGREDAISFILSNEESNEAEAGDKKIINMATEPKASGGSVKNYAYGGRVAAMSAEKS